MVDWYKNVRDDGFIRNKEMLNYVNMSGIVKVVIAFWDGKSAGTKNLIDISRKAGVNVLLKNY